MRCQWLRRGRFAPGRTGLCHATAPASVRSDYDWSNSGPTRAAGSAMPAATPAARRPLPIRPDRGQSWQPSTEGSIGAIGRCWGRPAAGFGAHDVPMPLIGVWPSAGGQRETVLARRMRALTAAARRPYLRALRTTRRATSRCHCPTPFPESISTFATSSAAVIFETTGCGTSKVAWSMPRPTPSPTATGVRSMRASPCTRCGCASPSMTRCGSTRRRP